MRNEMRASVQTGRVAVEARQRRMNAEMGQQQAAHTSGVASASTEWQHTAAAACVWCAVADLHAVFRFDV